VEAAIPDSPLVRFGPFELDLGRGILSENGAEIPLRPRPLGLLAYLVRHHDRVVSTEELFATLWPDVSVSDAALATALRDLRRALRDPGSQPRYVQTYRGRGYRFVHALAAARAAGLPLAPGPPVFVGRADLLAAADGWIAAADAGQGGAVLFGGDPGIGKTHALLELGRRAADKGLAVHSGRCLEEQEAPPYWPWVQILRSCFEGRARDELRDAAGPVAAALLHLIGGGAEERPAPGDASAEPAERLLLFDAVTRLLLAAAVERPRLLVLDDLHRADVSSALLLAHLLPRLPGQRVLLLGAYREGEVPAEHPLANLLAALHPAGRAWSLAGLEQAEVAELVRAISGGDVSSELAQALHARTGGNPLFVGEITRVLDRDGALRADAAALRAAAASPQGVRQVIRERVARLPGHTARVLALASVVGRDFDCDVLTRCCADLPAEAVASALDAAAQAGLVHAEAELAGRFRFQHILIRDALYEDIPAMRRGELHAAVGRALEELKAVDLDAHADALAHHFGQAAAQGEARRARVYARRSGERALAQAAYDEAAGRFAAALRALDLERVDGAESGSLRAARRERGELLLLLGRAHWGGGKTAKARESFAEAADLGRRTGSPELVARAALGYAGRTDATPGVNRVAVTLLEDALEALPAQDGALRAEVMARLGTELYYEPGSARCDELTAAAVAMAERLGDADQLAYALSARGYALMRPEVDPRRRVQIAERQVALAERGRSKDVAAIGWQEQIVALLELGDGARLAAATNAYAAVVRELRQPFFSWMYGALSGMRELLAGRVAEAERLAHETLARGRELGTPNALALFVVQLFSVRREQGRLAELEPLLRAALEDQPLFSGLRAGLAAVYAATERREEARDVFEQVLARELEEVARDQHWIGFLATLAPPCAFLGDERRARILYEHLVPYAERMTQLGHGAASHGSVGHFLGLLAATFQDFDAADQHFDTGLALERRMGARLLAAHSQREWALRLWKRGAPHEREQARGLLAEAAATYEALDLPYWKARIQRAFGDP
jgi:DNA-binding winged helix-turn-helix (wHTH) protein/tetratricopeptide (TPR) repeat protein